MKEEDKSAIVDRPNIVLINVDDLGWTDAATLSSDFYETPNIDRLAANGMKFSQCYAAAALCSPTRASIMTGKYPARLGITDWIRAVFQPGGKPKDRPTSGKNPEGFWAQGGEDAPFLVPYNPLWMELEETTIAELLRDAGYRTGHIGKWHLGADGYEPQDQGFEINIGGCDFGEPPSYFDPYTRGPLPEYDYDSIPGIPHLPPRKTGEYLTDREADEATGFIKNGKRPFFLHLCHYAVHVPLQAKNSLIEKYRNKPKGDRHKNATYAAMIESVDQSLGKVVQALMDIDQLENTIIIFTSDNGGLAKGNVTNNYPLRSGKGFPFEGGLRIPLIVQWPGKIAPSRTSDIVLNTVDFLPTICALTDVSLPAETTIDGVSFASHLLGTSHEEVRTTSIWHYPHYRLWDNLSPYSIIRKGNMKLIKSYEHPIRYELYDLKNDISEKNNLARARPEEVERLAMELDAELKQMHARFPIENPRFQPLQ
ncbi:sulfatase [Fulvivirgaceae bacterium BMA12]|uniref:Sulfatase n=1 Tax=Agaribacillus aureus TaxID=3051825 RepID=A0ABT8L669_9BACT|nr:sulfatase [Fulvivirgaceae bacterium BMA12]